MYDVNDLRRQRADLLTKRKDSHEAALKEKRDFTEDEQTAFDEAGKQAKVLEAKIAQADQIASEQASLAAEPQRTTDPDSQTINLNAQPRINVGEDRLSLDPTGGYGEGCGFGKFASDVRHSRTNMTDQLSKWERASRGAARMEFAAGDGMTSSIGSEGAYLIPSQFVSMMDKIGLETAVIRPRAFKIPVMSKSIEIPMLDDTTHSSGTVFGGVQAYFKSEEAQLTESKPQFANVELPVHKLTAMAYVTGDMLDFSPISMDTWLPMKLAQAMAWKEDDKFINGNGGAGEPIGILNSACILSIGKETGQPAASFVFENAIKMEARILFDNAPETVWLANKTVKTTIPKMTVDVGTGGETVALPVNGAAGATIRQLLGRGIFYTEHCQALGTTGDVYLVNCGEYLIADATSKTRTDRNMGLKFDYDQVAYRVITYTGGLMPYRSAFTPQSGDTLSPVIKLDARA